jgi:hypothetical protein
MIRAAAVMSEKEDVTSDLTSIGTVTSMTGSDARVLQGDELDAVSGGVVIAIIAVLIG